MLNPADVSAILLTLKLATTTTVLLLLLGTPLAWWLTHSKSWLRKPIGALVSLPLVLPPTVIGFYLLLFMGPKGLLGDLHLAFTFSGLVLGSILYSFPFVVQPIQNAFTAIGRGPLEAAAALQSSPWHRFFHVALPMAKNGLITATILGFAHTVGEFGVVLMIGGNIPNQTRVLSIAIYDQVETADYVGAGSLAFGLLIFSFVVLFLLQFTQQKQVETT
jgi:molybdate transport system permease protein